MRRCGAALKGLGAGALAGMPLPIHSALQPCHTVTPPGSLQACTETDPSHSAPLPQAGEEDGGAEEAQRARQRELAARFSQATAELQLVGFVKPAKRRRGDYVQRVAHMPAEADL